MSRKKVEHVLIRNDAKTRHLKAQLLKEEGNQCWYCGYTFGSPYMRNGKFGGYLKPTLDHVVPFSFCLETTKENSLLCCNVCNMLKGSKIYRNFPDLIFGMMEKWNKKGFELCEDPIKQKLR